MAGACDPSAGGGTGKEVMWQKVKANKPLAVLALLFLAGGIVTLGYFTYLIRTAGLSGDWPSTAGKLSKCRLSGHRSSSGGWRYGYTSRGETVTYDLDVEYDYHVDGVAYRGRRFYFGPRTGDREYWEEKAKRYCSDNRVEVYYDPRNPEQSVLETDRSEENYIFILMGLGFLGYGLYLARIIIRKGTP